MNKNGKSCAIIDIAIPKDIRVSENVERYQELRREIKRLWNIRNIKVIPVIVGALGSTSNKLNICIISTISRQKTALLGQLVY